MGIVRRREPISRYTSGTRSVGGPAEEYPCLRTAVALYWAPRATRLAFLPAVSPTVSHLNRTRLPLLAALLPLVACGGDSGTTPPPPPLVPSALSATVSTTLNGTVGAPTGIVPAVRVTSSDGKPVAGVRVDF